MKRDVNLRVQFRRICGDIHIRNIKKATQSEGKERRGEDREGTGDTDPSRGLLERGNRGTLRQ